MMVSLDMVKQEAVDDRYSHSPKHIQTIKGICLLVNLSHTEGVVTKFLRKVMGRNTSLFISKTSKGSLQHKAFSSEETPLSGLV